MRWHVGDRFQPLGFSTNGTLRAPVVFAGYGITAPGYDYDDYAGIDVRDRIVLVLSQEPGEMDSTSRFDGNVNTPHAEQHTESPLFSGSTGESERKPLLKAVCQGLTKNSACLSFLPRLELRHSQVEERVSVEWPFPSAFLE